MVSLFLYKLQKYFEPLCSLFICSWNKPDFLGSSKKLFSMPRGEGGPDPIQIRFNHLWTSPHQYLVEFFGIEKQTKSKLLTIKSHVLNVAVPFSVIAPRWSNWSNCPKITYLLSLTWGILYFSHLLHLCAGSKFIFLTVFATTTKS